LLFADHGITSLASEATEESLSPANNIVVFIIARTLKTQITASRKIAWLFWKDYCYGFSDRRILVHFRLTLNG